MEDKSNGVVYVETMEEEKEDTKTHSNKPNNGGNDNELTLCGVLRRLVSAIVASSGGEATPILHRIRASVAENAPLLPEASRNTARNVLLWTRRGTPLRALFVLSVGAIISLALTGLLLFMVFFVVATFNIIVISLLVSLAATGGFLALFLTCVTAIYIGALSIAAFVISTTAISTMIAVLITAGWIGFFCTVWLATKKTMGLAKHSLSMTSSAISTYSATRQAPRDPDKVSN